MSCQKIPLGSKADSCHRQKRSDKKESAMFIENMFACASCVRV